jgi:hydrogenase-4 membrane subunit HyfE
MDILKYRNLHNERTAAALAGTVTGVLTAVICAKTVGAGILLYVLSISLQLVVMILVAAWRLSAVVGINYLSVISRTASSVVVTLIIGLLAFVGQKLLFTALGGLTTLLLCVGFGLILQLIAILVLRVFDKEELAGFPLPFLTKRI